MHSHLTASTRIICIGNRYIAEDSLGIQVYDLLKTRALPEDVALVEGGLSGLDLLPYVEGARRVIFVDALENASGGTVIQRFLPEEVSREVRGFDHGSSFQYFLGILPFVMDSPLPEIVILGAAGAPDATIVRNAADSALEIAGGEV